MPAKLRVSRSVSAKLLFKHSVTLTEVRECFSNLAGRFLEDSREAHRSDPPTLWFVAETDLGRRLKVCFILRSESDGANAIVIKTAYDANHDEVRIYRKYGMAGDDL